MRRFSRITLAVALLTALGGFGGCWSGDRAAKAIELDALPGLSAVEYDGYWLRIKRPSGVQDGLALVVNSVAVNDATLQLGERFSMFDGLHHGVTYQLLVVGDERLVFKRREVIDGRSVGESLRTTEDVVAVRPYKLRDRE